MRFFSRETVENGAPDAQVPVLQTDVRPIIRAGLWVVAISVVGFGLWAGLTPLASGVHVMGKVAVETDRKTVQHLEGGIVKEILVKEGARVRKDDPLLVLEGTQMRANREAMLAKYLQERLMEARLLAERSGAARIVMPPDLREHAADPRLDTILQDQQKILADRRRQVAEESVIQQQRLAQARHQIESVEASLASATSQLTLMQREHEAMQVMLAKGFATATQARTLERDLEQLRGQQSSMRAELARLGAMEAEARQQLGLIRINYEKDINAQRDEVRARLRETSEMLGSADDMLSRTVIRAPQDGQVVGLAVHTVGGVVSGGSPLLFIVPEKEKLVLDGQLKPLDVSYVHAGMLAEVKFSGLPKRTTPLLKGRVTNVASDTLVDQATHLPYYSVRVEVGPEEMKLMEGSTITPGMPVEILLEADKRTVLEYLIAPWTDLFRKAMREH